MTNQTSAYHDAVSGLIRASEERGRLMHMLPDMRQAVSEKRIELDKIQRPTNDAEKRLDAVSAEIISWKQRIEELQNASK